MSTNNPENTKKAESETPGPKKPNEIEVPMQDPPKSEPDPIDDKEYNKMYVGKEESAPTDVR